jgi:hypothetical protein
MALCKYYISIYILFFFHNNFIICKKCTIKNNRCGKFGISWLSVLPFASSSVMSFVLFCNVSILSLFLFFSWGLTVDCDFSSFLSSQSASLSVSYSVSPPTSLLWSSMTDWFSSFSSCWLVSFRSSWHSLSLWPGLLHCLHVHWFGHSYILRPCCRHLLHLSVCFLGSI